MLDFFRNHKRLMMALLILIVVPGLAFVGIQGFRGFFDEGANVARVNGYSITRVEYDRAMREQRDQARQALGAQFDAKMFDTPARRRQLLDSLIQQRMLADETQRLHLTASDNAVRNVLLNDPLIASLKKPDGSIDVERYTQLLGVQGITPTQYDERVRYQLALQQIPASVTTTALASQGMARHLTELAEQRREVQGLILKASDYAARIQPTDAQLSAYYDAHKQAFATPETATIQYLVYSLATAGTAASPPTEDDIKRYYNDNAAHYRTDAQVRVSHIFLAADKAASAAAQAAARSKAEQLAAAVKADPEQFAQIAGKDSQDTPSAAKGGDLGFITRGSTAGGKAFDDVAFRLKLGEVSGVVQSDLGFHILKVTQIKPATMEPLDAVRAEITAELKRQFAARAFGDNAEGFSSLVYEKSKSLQPAADKYKLTIQTATVTSQPNPALPADSPLNNAKFLAAVFAPDTVKDKNNTQAIDVNSNLLIAARVTEYKAAATPLLATVQAAVRQQVIAEQAAQLAKQEGEAKLLALRKSTAAAGLTPPVSITRSGARDISPAALSEIYQVDAQKLPAYVGVDLGSSGYAIYRVNAVLPAAAVNEQRLTAAQQQIAQVYARSEMGAYLASLRARLKVKTNDQVMASGADVSAD